MSQADKLRVASSNTFDGIVSHKIAAALYRIRNGHPEILVKTAATIYDVSNPGSRFNLLQGDVDPHNDKLGYNAYTMMLRDYGLDDSAVQLMEVIPEPFLDKLKSSVAIRRKGFHMTSTRYVKMKLVNPDADPEGKGPYTWLTPPDVARFTQDYRATTITEVLGRFDFQLPA